ADEVLHNAIAERDRDARRVAATGAAIHHTVLPGQRDQRIAGGLSGAVTAVSGGLSSRDVVCGGPEVGDAGGCAGGGAEVHEEFPLGVSGRYDEGGQEVAGEFLGVQGTNGCRILLHGKMRQPVTADIVRPGYLEWGRNCRRTQCG